MTDGFNLTAHVLVAGEGCPDKVALAVLSPRGAERWSYARLTAAVLGTATGLAALGLPPGARVLLRLGNTPAFPVAFLGAIAAGLVPVPTSAALTAPEATRLARLAGPALVLAGDGVARPDHPAPVLAEADLTRFADLPPATPVPGDPERLAYIVSTSGSSGVPKLVAHAHRAILARAAMVEGWTGLTPADRLLHAGAMNWTFTLGTGLLDPWTLGATALVPAEGTVPEALPLLAARHGASLLAGAPGVFARMLRAWRQVAGLRHGLTAGERLTPALRAAWRDATGTDLHEAMGLSECSTFLSGAPARPAPEGTAGFPQPGRRVAILGPDGDAVPPGTEGRLAIHRSDPGLFLGYLDDPEATAARFAGDWFTTGDHAVARPDGAITVLAREDDLMNAGGFRVAPSEIEAVLAAVAGAGEVAVAERRLPSGRGAILAVWTGDAPQAALEAAAEAALAPWKRPRLWERREVLPRTPTGKISRRALREG